MNIFVSIHYDPLDIQSLIATQREMSSVSGAYVNFTGVARADDTAKGKVEALLLETYHDMAIGQLKFICENLYTKYKLDSLIVCHRVGRIGINEDIVFVGAGSEHRQSALNATEQLMDYLKNDVPIWKKEEISGESCWVEQKASDVEAKKRWE